MSRRTGISRANALIAVVVALAAGVGVLAFFLPGPGDLGDQWRYSAEGLGRFDPQLVLYDETDRRIQTGLSDSRGLAVGGDGRIYVAGDNAVRIFNERGELLRQIALRAPARCLTVTEQGELYVGVENHIEVYDAAGLRKAAWKPDSANSVITSIAVAGDDVFAADASNRIVLRYDTSGGLIRRIGKKDPAGNIPGFVVPSAYFDLAVGPDRLLRVVNPGRQRIETYTFDGYLVISWGKPGTDIEKFFGCCNPVNFAMLPEGGFVTAEKGLTRVKVFNAEGVFVGVVVGPDGFARHRRICAGKCKTARRLFGPDVAVDARSRILVLDPYTNEVRTFVRKTKPTQTGREKT